MHTWRSQVRFCCSSEGVLQDVVGSSCSQHLLYRSVNVRTCIVIHWHQQLWQCLSAAWPTDESQLEEQCGKRHSIDVERFPALLLLGTVVTTEQAQECALTF